jgi:hypothetical protein
MHTLKEKYSFFQMFSNMAEYASDHIDIIRKILCNLQTVISLPFYVLLSVLAQDIQGRAMYYYL